MANFLNQNLKGKIVILSSKYYKGIEEERKFKCESGFGCFPFTRGTAIFGFFINDNEKSRIDGYEIENEVKK